MNIGISTACFYPETIETAIDVLANNNVSNIEIFFNTYSELKKDYLNLIKQKITDGGITVSSIHPFTCPMEPLYFFSEYNGRFEDGIDQYKMYFETARFIGAKYIVFHGDYYGTRLPVEQACDRLYKLEQAAREYGVSILLENVSRCESREKKYIAEIKKTLKQNIGFTLDLKQAVRSGYDPFEVFETMGENIKHIHVSDFSQQNDCQLPLNGEFDFVKFFKKLKAIGYDGSILIEVYQDSYNDYSDIINSYNRLKKLLNNI